MIEFAFASPIQSAECQAVAASLSQPVAVDVRRIPAAEVGAAPVKVMSRQANPYADAARLGPFRYPDSGIEIRSSDWRFYGLVVDGRTSIHHRCGFAASPPSIWASDQELKSAVVRFEPARGIVEFPGAKSALEDGARPILAGHELIASWPVFASRKYYLGIMRPFAGSDTTVIVAFPAKPGDSPALVLANLPLKLTAIGILPFPHLLDVGVGLEGMSGDGALVRLTLVFPREEMDRIASELN